MQHVAIHSYQYTEYKHLAMPKIKIHGSESCG